MKHTKYIFGTFIVAMAMGLILASTGSVIATGVLHKVSVGGPDACEQAGAPVGCDANFSLNAIQFDDMTVRGHWTDQYGHGFGGFQADINCLVVVGNEAWVSGFVTHQTFFDGRDLIGLPVGTKVRDNGTTANDPPDQISFSFLGDPTSCVDMPDYPLFDKPRGHVKVR